MLYRTLLLAAGLSLGCGRTATAVQADAKDIATTVGDEADKALSVTGDTLNKAAQAVDTHTRSAIEAAKSELADAGVPPDAAPTH
jgi:hypothetical protein